MRIIACGVLLGTCTIGKAEWLVNIPETEAQPVPLGASVGSPLELRFVAPGTAPFVFSATGLPTWLELESSSGRIRGTPSTTNDSPFEISVSASDATGKPYPLAVVLTVSAPVLGDLGVETFAGLSQEAGMADGSAHEARFRSPRGAAVDSVGNIFIADSFNHVIRRISPQGTVSTYAGAPGKGGYADGDRTQALFNYPSDVAVEADGSIIVADTSNYRIRRISPEGQVTTVAGGHTGAMLFPEAKDGTGAAAGFLGPLAIAVDNAGMIYVGDRMVVRQVTPEGLVTTVAGLAGTPGYADGNGGDARFFAAEGIAVGPDGNLYVADGDNRCIRKVTPGGTVTTLAGLAGEWGSVDGVGDAARFGAPRHLDIGADGHLYVTDWSTNLVRRVSLSGSVTTAAGSSSWSVTDSRDGDSGTARFSMPWGLACFPDGRVLVVDSGNNTVRLISENGEVTTLAGPISLGSADGHGRSARFYSPRGIAVDKEGNIYVDDAGNFTIRKIAPDGIVSTFAGQSGMPGYKDGLGNEAQFGQAGERTNANALTVDEEGNVFFADRSNNVIRRISPDRHVTTVAGSAGVYGTRDGVGEEAHFRAPSAIAVGADGVIFVADGTIIRRISKGGAVSTFAGSYLQSGDQDGSGEAARFGDIIGMAFDHEGTLYVADAGYSTVRSISRDAVVTTVAGKSGVLGNKDGHGLDATFQNLTGLTIGSDGNIYVAQGANGLIRRVTPGGRVTTEAGVAGVENRDGVGTNASFRHPAGLAADRWGNIYITDGRAHVVRRARAGAPEFVVWPVSETVAVGDDVRLHATVAGKAPLNYQWYRLGLDGFSPIEGATAAELDIASVDAGDQGVYQLRVSNEIGAIEGNFVGLTASSEPVRPMIRMQPLPQEVMPGDSVILEAYATGGALTYQWYQDGASLKESARHQGVAQRTLRISGVAAQDLGFYSVRISNSAGEAISPLVRVGFREPRWERPALFDAAAYLASYPQLRSALVDDIHRDKWAWAHYLEVGLEHRWSDGSFEVAEYVNQYPEIIALYGGDRQAVAHYWYTVDRPQGLRVPAGFDVTGYFARHPEHAERYANDRYGAWLHYRDSGIYDGEVYDDLFRPEEYLVLYPELLAALGPDLKEALLHWLAQGRIEGRLGRIPLEFDSAGYFERNPDVAAAVGHNLILGWQHFWDYGIYEGRAYDEEFRVFEYLALNQDLQAAFLEDWRGATLHWLRYGRTEGRLGRVPLIFNVDFYLGQYPDVEGVFGRYPSTVFQHYYFFGVYEARIFDNEFRVDEYITLNPDLQAVFGTDRRGAFMHWVRWGRAEGRVGRL